jgi:tetratricopeptide (TPR) repeat protein
MKHLVFLSLLVMLACQRPTPSNSGASASMDTIPVSPADSLNILYMDSLNYKDQLAVLDRQFAAVQHPSVGQQVAHFIQRANVFASMKKVDSARLLLDAAQQLEEPAAFAVSTRILWYRAWANLFLFSNKYDSAAQAAMSAYQLARAELPSQLPAAIDILTNVYSYSGDTTNIDRYVREGMALHPPARYRSSYQLKVAISLWEKNLRDSAQKVIRAVLADTADIGIRMRAKLYENAGVMAANEQRLDKALPLLRHAMDLNHAMGDIDNWTYHNYAVILSKNKQRDKAIQYMDSAIQWCLQRNDIQLLHDHYGAKAFFQSKIGQFEDAFESQKLALLYYKKRDSAALHQKIHTIETRMGVQLKDEQIKVLDTAQKAALATSQKRIAIIIGLLVIMVLAGVLAVQLFRRQRLHRQISELQLEQRNLRTQMEPHFIFNALSQLMTFIQEHNNEKATTYLAKFSRLLGLILTNTRKTFVPLRDEVAALEAYLYLHQHHYEGQFTLNMSVYDGYQEEDLFIPPMVIQPFVENALHHGVRRLPGNGRLDITIIRQEHTIHCIVEDNGPGLQQRTGNAQKPSLSTVITQDRLAILRKQTGRPATLKIIDRRSEGAQTGVRVELTVPFRLTPAP